MNTFDEEKNSMAIHKEDILALEHRLIEAIKSSDIAQLDLLLHDELLFITPNGQTITKQMDLAAHKAREMIVEQLVPAFEEITILENTAIVVVVYDTKGTMLGAPIEGKFRYIRFWQQFSDGLKIIGGSCFKLN